MSFLTKLTEEGQKARSSLRKTSTIVTDVSGRRFHASIGTYDDDASKHPGYIVDLSPDPGLFECIPGLFIGSQDAAQNFAGVSVRKKKKGEASSVIEGVVVVDENYDFYPGMSGIGITHVLNLFSKDRPFEELGITYLNVNMLDIPEQSISLFLDESLQFIHNAIGGHWSKSGPEKPGKVLVHCNAGVSRSSTIIIAYLIKYKSMAYRQALELVRKNRPAAKPNAGFETQLLALEREQLREH